MALVSDDARRSATVAALEEAETFAIYQSDFARLRRQYPGVNEVVIDVPGERVACTKRAPSRSPLRSGRTTARRLTRRPPADTQEIAADSASVRVSERAFDDSRAECCLPRHNLAAHSWPKRRLNDWLNHAELREALGESACK